MSDDPIFDRLMENFKEIFTDVPLATKREILETIIRTVVKYPIETTELTNKFSFISNIIKLTIEEKLVNPNEILTYLVKHTENYVGLYYIGMVFRSGCNPNIYINLPPYGNIHILCLLALRKTDLIDPYFRYICMLLRSFGSNINYPAFNLKNNDTSSLDINYVERIAGELGKDDSVNISVAEFIRIQGKLPDEKESEFLNSINFDSLLNYSIAKGEETLFETITALEEFKEIFDNEEESKLPLIRLFIDISTASSTSIANLINEKIIPTVDKFTVNAQKIPIYSAIISGDKDLFKLLISKGSMVKYVSMTSIIASYKKYKREELNIYKNYFSMILDSVNIGADIDIYQFDLLTSAAEFREIEAVRKAYDTPKWKKLCSVMEEKPNQEIKQIAFELNLDFNRSRESICSKLKQISLLDKNQFLESAIRRQEDRISTELSTILDFPKDKLPPKARCSLKSTVIKNPYAYNDTRMAFFRDPEEDEVWCFTSDTFSNLIQTKINPYTGRPLPDKFVETIKAQVNILKELGLFNFNNTIKDTLKEYFERSKINNKKTDYAYNTVIKCLSLYGLSEERFNTLSEITLGETILNEICDVKLKFLENLTPKHMVIITSRIIYSISKSLENPSEFYETIARSVLGNMEDLSYEEEGEDEDEDELNKYLSLLD